MWSEIGCSTNLMEIRWYVRILAQTPKNLFVNLSTIMRDLFSLELHSHFIAALEGIAVAGSLQIEDAASSEGMRRNKSFNSEKKSPRKQKLGTVSLCIKHAACMYMMPIIYLLFFDAV